MPDLSSPVSPWIKTAIAFGVLGVVISAGAAWRLTTLRETEAIRYQACEQGTRQDCEPSIFWVLAGFVKVDKEGKPQVAFSDTGEPKKQVIRTSDTAPMLTSLRPEGLIPEGQGYRVTVGTDVKFSATIEKAKKVEARLQPTGSDESVLLGEMKSVKDQPDTYQFSFRWTDTRSGDLEIRAYGEPDSEQVRLLLPLRVGE